MSVDEIDSLDQKRKSIEILQALALEGGEANTTVLRKATEFDDRHKVTYRVNEYLEPAGLVDTHQPEGDGSRVNPPKEMTLTEDGREFVETIDEQGLYGQIADRLDRLEKQVDGLRQENRELREENEELKAAIEGSDVETVTSRVKELTDDVDRLQAKMSNMQEAIGETQTHPLIQSRETAEGFDAMLVMMNACRRIIEEEIEDGEARLEQERSDVRETLSERDRLLTDE